jgi:mannose-6-phosphate isomerase class I
LNRPSEYDKSPAVRVTGGRAWQGWADILAHLRGEIERGATSVAIECYPGVLEEEVLQAFQQVLRPEHIFRTRDILKPAAEIDAMLSRDLTDDPVFGRMNGLSIQDFADPARVSALRRRHAEAGGLKIIIGTGTALIEPSPTLLIYADMARWEIQLRQRAGLIGNLGADNQAERPSLKYKRAYFVDWRVADRIKRSCFDSIDYLLDTNDVSAPKMASGEAVRQGLRQTAQRPFRVVPFFDPGPWGGQWMRRECGLPDGPPNYAWCFDCVPEENSLLLDFDGVRVELPSIDLVFQHPRELLGEAVYARFGAEFPIRFDFLDTMEGGNLSLQVHPLTECIREQFGMAYTQDESYYILDAGEQARVYLGVKLGLDRTAMIGDLRRAQEGGAPFPAEQYVNCWPARKHDHFLIPGGTVHCSGADSMVLEISATPYIFTFKLWDWDRLGLDGRPRPVHLDHGIANIQWDRDTSWVADNLINRVHPLAAGDGWREERTGLHPLEFIETRRHWFTATVPHHTRGTVNVLNLVEGPAVIVESPDGAFEPFVVHYAETFVVPAAVGPYTIRPAQPAGAPLATIKASVRDDHAAI